MTTFVYVKTFTQISSIIVALLFIFTINFKSIITLNYFVNQTEIIDLFCVNKEKPQLQCQGKCHLTKELAKTDQQEDTPFSPNNTTTNLEITAEIISEDIELNNTSKAFDKSWEFISENILIRFSSVLSPPPKTTLI